MNDAQSHLAVIVGEQFADGLVDVTEVVKARVGAMNVLRAFRVAHRHRLGTWGSEDLGMGWPATEETANEALTLVALTAVVEAVESHAQPARLLSPYCGLDVLGVAKQHADLLRDIIGNPFRPLSLGLYVTDRVRDLAFAAYQLRDNFNGRLDLERLAVLSDALEEAGCPSEIKVTCRWCDGTGVYDNDLGEQTACAACSPEGKLPGSGEQKIANPFLAHLREPGPHVRGCWVLDQILQSNDGAFREALKSGYVKSEGTL